MRNIIRDLSISMLVLAFVLSGCGSKATPTATEVPPTNTPAPPPPTEPPAAEVTHEAHEEQHEEGDTHSPEEHVAGHHDVPEEAAAVENPIPATEESIAEGRRLYATNCALCHGETGRGDGPAVASLDKPPANLHEDHVQENSDGALFWIISHGRPDTPMPAWDNVLSEEERWNLVNFLRTFELESE